MAYKILSPCGILGYGYPLPSFMAGMAEKPDAIVVDAGSTDAGPHKLGAGVAIVSRQAMKKDLLPMLTEGIKHGIPVIIGSAGGSGGKVHVEWTLDVIQEVIEEEKLHPNRIAVIWADIPKDTVLKKLKENKVYPLNKTVPLLTEERLSQTTGIVAQMGMEPIIEALKNKADIIVCGRAYDPSPFAAPAVLHGCDPALAYHMGKILECAALCAVPGSAKDCILGIINEDSFTVKPLNPLRKCTKTSVAAHTFYEKDHPYRLKGPGIAMNLEQCLFQELGDGSVKVSGSKITFDEQYQIKLEGAMLSAYRTFVIAGVRDPMFIENIKQIEDESRQIVMEHYSEVDTDTYKINFINYGINGVMGELESPKDNPYEVAVLFEVLADTQEKADMLCATLRSTILHFGYEGRKSTSGNLAFPYAPSDISFGPVYEFSVYHLMETDSATEMFPIEYRNVEYRDGSFSIISEV